MLQYNSIRQYDILYYTILYYTRLYYTGLYYTILYYTILLLYYTILYYNIHVRCAHSADPLVHGYCCRCMGMHVYWCNIYTLCIVYCIIRISRTVTGCWQRRTVGDRCLVHAGRAGGRTAGSDEDSKVGGHRWVMRAWWKTSSWRPTVVQMMLTQ